MMWFTEKMHMLGMLIVAVNIFMQNTGAQEPLRAGMIGLDTSHVPAFARIFNNPQASGDLRGIKIVAGYPGGTDFPASRDRVDRFTEQVRGMGVEIVKTIPELLAKVDVVLLESVDGRIHLEEAAQVIKSGKPLFIDKPAAGSLADAIAIYELAKKYNVPVFSSSSYRFYPGLRALLHNDKVGDIVGAATWGPCSYQSGTPDMVFYGIHGIEALFTLMGTGCQSVSRIKTADADLVSGTWTGGRIGTYRGIRKNNSDSGAIAFGTKGIVRADKEGSYADLCQAIGKFFRSKVPPVSAETTIEMFAFMEAADESQRRGGAPVSISDVLETGHQLARTRLSQFDK